MKFSLEGSKVVDLGGLVGRLVTGSDELTKPKEDSRNKITPGWFLLVCASLSVCLYILFVLESILNVCSCFKLAHKQWYMHSPHKQCSTYNTEPSIHLDLCMTHPRQTSPKHSLIFSCPPTLVKLDCSMPRGLGGGFCIDGYYLFWSVNYWSVSTHSLILLEHQHLYRWFYGQSSVVHHHSHQCHPPQPTGVCEGLRWLCGNDGRWLVGPANQWTTFHHQCCYPSTGEGWRRGGMFGINWVLIINMFFVLINNYVIIVIKKLVIIDIW